MNTLIYENLTNILKRNSERERARARVLQFCCECNAFSMGLFNHNFLKLLSLVKEIILRVKFVHLLSVICTHSLGNMPQ